MSQPLRKKELTYIFSHGNVDYYYKEIHGRQMRFYKQIKGSRVTMIRTQELIEVIQIKENTKCHHQ